MKKQTYISVLSNALFMSNQHKYVFKFGYTDKKWPYIWYNFFETVRHITTQKKKFGYHSKTWPMKWKKTIFVLNFHAISKNTNEIFLLCIV